MCAAVWLDLWVGAFHDPSHVFLGTPRPIARTGELPPGVTPDKAAAEFASQRERESCR